MFSFFRQHLYQTMLLIITIVSFAVITLWPSNMQTAVLKVGDKKVYVQIAETIQQQHVGLGGRETLSPYGGMVFLFVPAKKTGIVMRDMLFPIDIIWTLDGVVVDIAPNIQPQVGVPESELTAYFPRKESNLVLEVKAGFAQQYNIQIGDSITIIDE